MFRRALPTVCLLVVVLAIFGPTLFGNHSVGFRDTGHFYYPLFLSTQQAWSDGIPLWNPYDGLGHSLIGDGSSSLFYPGKLLFALPGSFDVLFNLYIAVHLLLAMIGTFWVARRWGRSVEAAILSALAYGLGGAVLSQTCNVVFLVGAAWLPLSWWAVDRMLRRPGWRRALVAGATWALMVLGGDPQLAYNVALMAAIYACLLGSSESERGWARLRLTGLVGVAALFGLALAAIQVLPTRSAGRVSVRSAYDLPRSLYEIPAFTRRQANEGKGRVASGIQKGLLAAPDADQANTFEFSVAPWRCLEWFWPNINGRFMPENRCWQTALPASGRIWSGSYYMGLLPIMLALVSWSLRRGEPFARGLSWMALLALLASLGWFGIGWLVHEAAHAVGAAKPQIGQAVGGPYWFLTVLLPGYVHFRYPAKLFVGVALAASLLAGLGWDNMFGDEEMSRVVRRRTARISCLVLVLTLLLAATAWSTRILWEPLLRDAKPDAFFGPIFVAGAFADFNSALLHCGVLCLLILLGQRYYALRTARWALLVLIAAELLLANRWLVPLVPTSNWKESLAVRDIAKPRSQMLSHPPRIFRSETLQHPWTDSSPQRIVEATRWEHDTLYPRHHSVYGIGSLSSAVSLPRLDMQSLLDWCRARSDAERRIVLRELGVDYRLKPGRQRGSVSSEMLPRSRRIWITRRVTALPELARSPSPQAVAKRTDEVWRLIVQSRQDERPPSHRPAFVEWNGDLPRFGKPGAVEEPLRVVRPSNREVVVELRLKAAALLVVNDQYDRGWQAHITQDGQSRRTEVLRVNRVMRGIQVPAGDSVVRLVYRPREFSLGMIVSVLASLILGFVLIRPRS